MTKTPAAGAVLQVNISSAWMTIPGLEGIPEFGPEKTYYENTAIDDTAKTFGADLPDPGELTITGSWDSKNTAHAYLESQARNTSASDAFQVVFHSGAKSTFTGLIGAFRTSAQKGQDEKFSAKIRLSGAVNYVAAS